MPAGGRSNKRHLNSADNVLGGKPPPLPGPHGGARGAPVSSVALSPCGNFGIVGSSSGRVDRYNMQSGLHRGVYGRVPDPSELQGPGGRPLVGPGTGIAAEGPAAALLAAEAAAAALKPAHEGAVTGLGVDSCNRVMVSAGTDAVLRLWDFRTMKVRAWGMVGHLVPAYTAIRFWLVGWMPSWSTGQNTRGLCC
jgi:U3 small nucleolar RNA-associated protein 21